MSTDIKRACRWSVVDRGLLDGPFDDSLTDIMDQRRRKKELFDQTDTKLVIFLMRFWFYAYSLTFIGSHRNLS